MVEKLVKIILPGPRVDYSQTVFFQRRIRQSNYDREIDEGRSSDLIPLTTVDVTDLSKRQVRVFLSDLLRDVNDFDFCKFVDVVGYSAEDAKYFTISGETHAHFVPDTRELMRTRVRKIVGDRPVKLVESPVQMPLGMPYRQINLGPYGSTGAPFLGIPPNSDAARLREKGEIR